MQIWIYQKVEGVTDSYHSGAGIAVLARSKKERDTLIPSVVAKTVPDAVYRISCGKKTKSRVFIFPDAGCC